MFKLSFSGCAFESLHCVDLRCHCGNTISVDTDSFAIVRDDYVILKDIADIRCNKCGFRQPQTVRRLDKETQYSSTPVNVSCNDDTLLTVESALIW